MVIQCNKHILHLCYIHDPGDHTSTATEPPQACMRSLNNYIITQLITAHFTLSCMWHHHFVLRPPTPQSRSRTIEQTFCWGLNLSHVSSFWVISTRTHICLSGAEQQLRHIDPAEVKCVIWILNTKLDEVERNQRDFGGRRVHQKTNWLQFNTNYLPVSIEPKSQIGDRACAAAV